MSWTPTALADVLQKTPISDYISALLPNATAFANAGILDTQFSPLLGSGGSTVEIRRFAVDATASELDDGTASEGNKLSSYKDIAVVTRRKRVRGIDVQTVAALGGDAVATEIANESAYYWGSDIDTALSKVLTALFDASSGVIRTTHKSAKAAASGPIVTANYPLLIDLAKLGGDKMNDFRNLVVHPNVWADLVKDSAAKPLASPAIGGGALIGAGSFAGWNVFISDRVPTTGSSTYKSYSSFLFKPGALGLMWQMNVNTRTQYDAYKNTDIITQSVAYAPHAFGVKWSGTASSAAGPTDAELATATNWTKVATNDKEIGVLCLTTNASA